MALLMGSVSACGGEEFTAGDREAWDIFCRDEYLAPILATSTTTTRAPLILDGVEVTFGPEPVQLPPAATFCTRHAKDISNRINEGWSKSCATTYYKQKVLKQNPDPYMCE